MKNLRILLLLCLGGFAAAQSPNLSSTTPAAPSGGVNCLFQYSGLNVSCYIPSGTYDPANAAATALTSAETFSGNAANLTNGTIPVARLPLATSAAAGAVICGTGTSCASGVMSVTAGSGGTTLTENLFVNDSTTSKFFCETDSIGLPLVGSFCQVAATTLGIPSGNRFVNNIGSASGADMLSCNTADGCAPGGSYPYQVGVYPLTFPLGVANDAKTLLEVFGYNDLSNMGAAPTAIQLSYFYGGLKGWMLEFGTPDSEKLTASGAYCTTTGTWTSVSAVPGGSGAFPAGTVESTTPGSTITCAGLNATDAGFISYKYTGSSSATFTVTATNAGTTYNVADPYTASTTLTENAPYASTWGGEADLYAVGEGGMSGGYTSITLTTASNSSDPVIVVAPYFISPSSSPQNAPAVEVMLESRAGCNGACSTVSGSLHNDANTNTMRAAQIAAVNELRSNGLNTTYFDPNATPTGYNSSDTSQTTKLTSFAITAGGSGFTGSTSTPTITGCTINPSAAAIPVSGGALAVGTYYPTSEGSCLGATVTITFSGGGTGVAYTAATNTDGTHPNQTGSNNIAATSIPGLNSAAQAQDHYLPPVVPTLQASACPTGQAYTSVVNGVLVCGTTTAVACGSGYLHNVPLTVASSSVSGGSNLSYYPALLGFNGATTNSITLANLKSFSNSGQVQSSTGADITFCSAASGGTTLPYELVGGSYVAATGAAEFYVSIPTLSASTSTTIYAFWDDATATSSAQPTTVWTLASYVYVNHFGTPATLGLTDSTGNTTALTNNGGATASAGEFGGAVTLTSGENLYNASPVSLPVGTASRTLEAWVKFTTAPTAPINPFGYGANSAGQYFEADVYPAGDYVSIASLQGSADATYTPDAVWHDWVFTVSSSNPSQGGVLTYKDGANLTMTCVTTPCTTSFATAAGPLQINGVPGTSTGEGGETVDEFRISSVARTAGWIATQYANQSNPSTFFTLGTID